MPFVFSHIILINIQNSANSVRPSLQNAKLHETKKYNHDRLNRSGRAQPAPFDSEFWGAQIIFHFSYFADPILNANRENPRKRVLEQILHFSTRRAARRVQYFYKIFGGPDWARVGGHFIQLYPTCISNAPTASRRRKKST